MPHMTLSVRGRHGAEVDPAVPLPVDPAEPEAGADGAAVCVGVAVVVTAGAVWVTVGVVTTTDGVTVWVTVGVPAGEVAAGPPAVPNTLVPLPPLPRTRSLNGRPATTSTPVTTARTATNEAIEPMAIRRHAVWDSAGRGPLRAGSGSVGARSVNTFSSAGAAAAPSGRRSRRKTRSTRPRVERR